MKQFTNETDGITLVRAAQIKLPDLTFSELNRLLRKRDVKVNGIRISENIRLKEGDVVLVYCQEHKYVPDIIYSDDNIVIVDKRAGIESEELAQVIGAIAVHRLDRNTEGLNAFAKNRVAEQELRTAFLERATRKLYLAEVIGHLLSQEGTLTAYLKKDAVKALVSISDKQIPDSVRIVTKYRVLKMLDNTDIVEIELLTGKTHQIRAHFAHIGHPIAGDGKYGNNGINKAAGYKRQRLLAYKLAFFFKPDSCLSYFSGRTFLSERRNSYGLE